MSTTLQKTRPTRENWKEYQSILDPFGKDSSSTVEEQITAYNEAQAYADQFDWFCYTFDEDGKFGMKNCFGEVVIPAAYEEFFFLPSYEYLDSVGVIAVKDGKVGLIHIEDDQCKEITDFIYDDARTIHFTCFVAVCKDDKWGVADIHSGELVVPIEMDDVETAPANFCLFLEKDGKQGVYDFYIDALAYPEYDEIDGHGEGGALIFKKDGVEGQVDERGKFYPMSLLDRYYAGEETDEEGNPIFEDGEEPCFISDHLDV